MNSYSLNPAFFKGTKGDIFTLSADPLGESRGHIFYLPAHGEELNRCRTAVASHAKSFAAAGFKCTIVDYYGTGDSDGDFAQGNIKTWVEDLLLLILATKKNSASPIYLAGFRLGALIALLFLDKHRELPIKATLLAQPVTQGKQYVTQLLRQRVAATLSAEGPKESTDELRKSFKDGQSINVSGYEFGAAFLNELDRLSLSELSNIKDSSFFWLEFIQNESKGLSIGAKRAMSSLESAGNKVAPLIALDPPIWQLHERAIANNHITAVQEVAAAW